MPTFSQPLSSIYWGYTAPSVIDVYFAPSGLTVDDGYSDFPTFTTTSWSPYEIGQAMQAFGVFEDIANVTFNQVANINDAEFVMLESTDATTALGYWGVSGGTVRIDRSFYALDGWGVFNSGESSWSTAGLAQGGYGFVTLIHEIGHGMGLAHPHDNGGVSTIMDGVTSAFGDLGDHDLNQGIWTTMTYNDGWQTAPHGVTPSDNYGYQGTVMALDIAVLQAVYGNNTSHNMGNDIYTLPIANAAGTYYSAIWDAGGIDMIFHPGSAAAIINLNAAPLTNTADGGGYVSYVAGIHGGFTIANGALIENAIGGTGDDEITGNAADNELEGSSGDDTLAGGAGADSIDGGAGIDVLDFTDAPGRIFADIQIDQRGAGFLRFYDVGQPEGDVYANLEDIAGGDYADNLRGNEGANRLWGGGVSDRLYGRAGDDVLEGDAGADALYGNLGADTMAGGVQADRRDRFIYFDIRESGVGAGNRDVITDFAPGEDRIEISRFDADTTTGGRQDFTFIGDAGFSGTVGELGYLQIGGATIVQADVDGSGVADFEIELSGLLTLSEDDFLL